MATGIMVGPTPKRKILLSVKDWSSEESIHTWKFLKSHLLQAKQEGAWKDELLVVHIARSKEKEKDKWDHGNAVIADLATSLQPFKHDVYDLEGDAGQLLVDIAHREQADILVLASRGRNAMKKAMMGSMTDSVIQRVSCPCLVVKPQIGAGDTYRMKTAAQPQAMPLQQFGPAAAASLQPVRANSPSSSPMYGRMASSLAMPFNRRVAIVYDTTATGRFLLKWATDMVLEPADNVFVVRAVPKVRQPSTSFADKNSVQRMAHDMLPSQAHVMAFNVQFSQQQGNRCRSVLSFVAKESVDLLIIGLYKTSSRRKGLALKGNALALASRCACSCLVVPMSESGLVSCAEAADLEATAEEEDELVSGSENESDDEDPITPTAAHNGAAGDTDEEAGIPSAVETGGGSPDTHGGSFAMRGASAMKQIRAPLEALFKRRGSTAPAGLTRERDGEGGTTSGGGGLPSGLDARRTALLATLHGSTGGLPAGKYVVEVDQSGALKHIKVLVEKHHGGIAPIAVTTATAEGDNIRIVTTPVDAGAGTEGTAAGAGPLTASNSSATTASAAVHRQASTAAGAAPAPSPTAPSGIPPSSSTGSLTTEAAATADGAAGTAGATAGQQQPHRTLSASQQAAAGAMVQEQ